MTEDVKIDDETLASSKKNITPKNNSQTLVNKLVVGQSIGPLLQYYIDSRDISFKQTVAYWKVWQVPRVQIEKKSPGESDHDEQ